MANIVFFPLKTYISLKIEFSLNFVQLSDTRNFKVLFNSCNI